VVSQRTFTLEADPTQPATARYADAYLRRARSAFTGQLPPADLSALNDC